MSQGFFKNLVRLNKSEREKLLNSLDDSTKAEDASICNSGKNRRQCVRYEYRIANIPIAIEHPGGTMSHMLVCGRNLSSGGISFVHGGYLHNGTRCGIVLFQTNRTKYAVEGAVVNSRHLKSNLHEVSIKFSKNIDVKLYLEPDRNNELLEESALDEENDTLYRDMIGKVLYIDSNEYDISQFKTCIAKSGMQVRSVSSADEAISNLQRDNFDIIVIDFEEIKENILSIIPSLRKQGHKGPVVIANDERQAKRLEGALDSGATHILKKPYKNTIVLNILRKCMKIVKDQLEQESSPIGKTEQAYKLAAELEVAMKQCNQEELKSLCSRMIESPEAKIFLPIQEAAEAAICSLNAESVNDSLPAIERLITRCNNILQWKCQGDK